MPTMTMTNMLYQELEQAAKMTHALYRYILRCLAQYRQGISKNSGIDF